MRASGLAEVRVTARARVRPRTPEGRRQAGRHQRSGVTSSTLPAAAERDVVRAMGDWRRASNCRARRNGARTEEPKEKERDRNELTSKVVFRSTPMVAAFSWLCSEASDIDGVIGLSVRRCTPCRCSLLLVMGLFSRLAAVATVACVSVGSWVSSVDAADWAVIGPCAGGSVNSRRRADRAVPCTHSPSSGSSLSLRLLVWCPCPSVRVSVCSRRVDDLRQLSPPGRRRTRLPVSATTRHQTTANRDGRVPLAHSGVTACVRLVLDHGLPPANIITFSYNDVASDPSNPFPGKLFNAPTDAGVPGVDVYQGGGWIDYQGAMVTPEVFLAVLTNNVTGVANVTKTLQSTAEDRVFVNFVDHGGAGLVAFPTEYLYATDLIPALQQMFEQKMYKQLVF